MYILVKMHFVERVAFFYYDGTTFFDKMTGGAQGAKG
jgi:hypothetical protein